MYFFYYFPVGLDVRPRRKPVITIYLAALSVIIFLYYRYVPYGHGLNLDNLVFLPARPMILTSFSHVFLHAGWLHLAGNCVYLLIFGPVLEDRLGPGRFFTLFALSAMAGAWTHAVFTALWAPEFIGYGVIGASGATSGLLGAYIVRFHFSRIRVAYWVFMPLQGVNRAGRKHVPGIFAIAFWLIYQGVYTVMQFGTGAMHVAYSVHIGGFTAGILLAILFGARAEAKAESRIVKARKHILDANWFAAQGEFLNYLDMVPGDAAAHAEAARAFICGGELARAKYHYNEAIASLISQSERGEAENVFFEAMRSIEGFTLSEKDHLTLAYGMERSLKYNGAIKAYENFIEWYPRSAEVPFVLLRMAGMNEMRFGRYEEAYGYYNRLINDYPDDGWADFAKAEIGRLESMRVVLTSSGSETG